LRDWAGATPSARAEYPAAEGLARRQAAHRPAAGTRRSPAGGAAPLIRRFAAQRRNHPSGSHAHRALTDVSAVMSRASPTRAGSRARRRRRGLEIRDLSNLRSFPARKVPPLFVATRFWLKAPGCAQRSVRRHLQDCWTQFGERYCIGFALQRRSNLANLRTQRRGNVADRCQSAQPPSRDNAVVPLSDT
jgi:hypothetical protein